ncbi:hypothetical protein AHAS_Ahas15G0178100 [Arachis hypogaea]
MLSAYLSREARTWQQIFAHYVLPTTHFSEIPMDMMTLIGCVMERKEVYFPRLIRHSMWRAHIRGLLPFPTLVTSLAELADVPWEDDDATPPPPVMMKSKLLFHGVDGCTRSPRLDVALGLEWQLR